MALLAVRLAEQGYPVFRFDRRGVGDSMGENRGWSHSAPDIAAAAAYFRDHQPRLRRLVSFGNCDAATALALFGKAAGIDALILSNPWLEDRDADGLPSAPAIRARYAARLRDPASWRRGVNIMSALNGLRKILKRTSQPKMVNQMVASLAEIPLTLILADQDATAQAFNAAWTGPTFAKTRIRATFANIRTASHSYARPGDAAQLEAAILAALRA